MEKETCQLVGGLAIFLAYLFYLLIETIYREWKEKRHERIRK